MLAHLVERFHGMEEVRSSNLLHSTNFSESVWVLFLFLGEVWYSEGVPVDRSFLEKGGRFMEYFNVETIQSFEYESPEVMADYLVAAFIEHTDLVLIPRVGFQRLCFRRIRYDEVDPETRKAEPHQENDYEHTLMVDFLIWLTGEFYGAWMPGVNFAHESEAAKLHDVPENLLGDIPHNGEGDRNEKNRVEEKLMQRYLKFYPSETRRRILRTMEPFYRDKGFLFVMDKLAFVMTIGWYELKGSRPDFELAEKLYGFGPYDKRAFRILGDKLKRQGDGVSLAYAGWLILTRGYFYRSILILVVEALYRRLGREVPSELKKLY